MPNIDSTNVFTHFKHHEKKSSRLEESQRKSTYRSQESSKCAELIVEFVDCLLLIKQAPPIISVIRRPSKIDMV